MRRVRVFAAATVLLAAAGCSGEITGTSGDESAGGLDPGAAGAARKVAGSQSTS